MRKMTSTEIDSFKLFVERGGVVGGEIGLKVLQVIAITGSADEIGLQCKEEGSHLKKSKCNVVVLKEKLQVIKKRKKKLQCNFKQ